MNLSNLEKKLVMLAMDAAATEYEMAVASTKLLRSWRERFKDGVELIKALESGVSAPLPGDMVFATRQQAQAAADAMNRGFSTWSNIMRDAQEMAAKRAAAQQQQRKQTWQDFCKRAFGKDWRDIDEAESK